MPRCSKQAWGAIATTALFLCISFWWLTQDRSIPIYDAGLHLSLAFEVYSQLGAGHVVKALTLSIPYPPFAYLIGDVGIAIGGINVAPPIIAENLVFVPLLALGCYHVGRIAFDRTAGLLAVVFALGSPLITAQFHVFMVDAPETAMVAASLWAVLATDGFSKVRISAVAGLAVGVGLLTKEPFAFFVAGPVIVTAIRGGVKAWRGLLVFALVALVVALPWYAHELSQVKSIGSGAVNAGGKPVYGFDISPEPYSFDNFAWYFWNILNAQLYLPLFVFSVVGWLWALAGFLRRKPVSRVAPELVVGAFVAWFAITETFTHDTRYSMPMLIYLAVFGVGWVTRLPRPGRAIAIAILVLASVATVVGTSFGIGEEATLTLPGANASYREQPGLVRIFSNRGFLVSGPHWDGDILATLEALKHDGIKTIALEPATLFDPIFSWAGMTTLSRVAGLNIVEDSPGVLTQHYAFFHHGEIGLDGPRPCVKLLEGTGVWIRIGDPETPDARDYCPSHKPKYYG